MNFEIIVRQVEKGKVIKESLIKEIQVSEPKSIMDIGFRHSEQISIISSIQDSYIPLQCKLLFTVDACPKCGNKPMRNGTHTVSFHSSLSDHKIKAQGYSCSCGWQSRPTVHGIFGSNVHPDLIKTQATLGAKMPYKDAQLAITEFNCSKRSVNNHVKIAEATNKVGEILHEAKIKEEVNVTKQGFQMNQDIVFLSDGGDTVRDLQQNIAPYSEHLLDWFHITMRITVMKQMVSGLLPGNYRDQLDKQLESIKWNIWHGNVNKALDKISSFSDDCYEEKLDKDSKKHKLWKYVDEFYTYI